VPDEDEQPVQPEGGQPESGGAQGPDLTKPAPAEPTASPYEAASPWAGQQGQQQDAQPQHGSYQQAQYEQSQYQQPQYAAYQRPQHPQPYGAPAPYGQAYGAGYAPAAPPTSGKATAVLVLGIASLVLVFMCGIGLITAIIALVMAPGAKREIKESQGRLTGLGMVQGGVVTSWITVGIVVLLVAVLVLVMAVGGSIGSDFDYSHV
jgi:hypothetical protein